MDTHREGMTRREFLKRNVLVVAALAFFASPLRSFADYFRRQPRRPNVSDKEARYYKTLAFIRPFLKGYQEGLSFRIRNSKVYPLG